MRGPIPDDLPTPARTSPKTLMGPARAAPHHPCRDPPTGRALSPCPAALAAQITIRPTPSPSTRGTIAPPAHRPNQGRQKGALPCPDASFNWPSSSAPSV